MVVVDPGVTERASGSVVDCAVYVDGTRLPGRWEHAEAVAEVRRRGAGFVWIGLFEPAADRVQGVAETFGLHELAVEDAVCAHQRPKLDRYGDMLFMVLKTVRYVENDSPTRSSSPARSWRSWAGTSLSPSATASIPPCGTCEPSSRRCRSGCRPGPPRCCTRSPTTSWTPTWT